MKVEKFKDETKILISKLEEYATGKGIYNSRFLKKQDSFIQSNVSRIFAGKYPPLLDNFLQLAEAIGYHIELKENLDLNKQWNWKLSGVIDRNPSC